MTVEERREYARNYMRERRKMLKESGLSSLTKEQKLRKAQKWRERCEKDPEYKAKCKEASRLAGIKYRAKMKLEKLKRENKNVDGTNN